MPDAAIFTITLAYCIQDQRSSENAARQAERYVRKGLLGRAAQEQRKAAIYHREMSMRLDRLIGVA